MDTILKDEELMVAYQRGEAGALEEIFRRYKQRLLNYGLRLMSNLADAEDIVSETFFALTSRKDAYKPKAKFSSWIYSIAHNFCIDKFRYKKRTASFWKRNAESDTFEEIDLMDLKPGADETAACHDLQARIRNAICRLPLNYREALVLREYENLSYEEIAKVLACSIANVKVLILRARERLKREILPWVREVV